MITVVSTGNYIYDFLTDTEKTALQEKTLKKKFQKYHSNKVKFHALMEEDEKESKECNLELVPHIYFS